MVSTHEVQNQPPPLDGYDVYSADAALVEAVARHDASWASDRLTAIGTLAGSAEAQEWGRLANDVPPVLHTVDRYGRRVDEVEFHPAWHQLMQVAVGNGLHASSWVDARPGAQVARAAAFSVWSQVEGGHGCPVSMTYAAVPALRQQPELAAQWQPRMTTLDYDFGLRPPATKKGVLFGMAMTERQGGSDVRANTTRAEPADGDAYRITGAKWFCSAPMCDAFLVLAQAPGGLSCFLMPRVLDDGTRNGFHIQRLKDKLGNRSNASSEVEFDRAWALMVGEEGRGIRTILEMVNHTRLDCVIGSASLMRQAVAQATHHAAHRSAFGRLLSEQPLMVNVLADLAVESEATTLLMMRIASAFDRATDPHEAAFKRLALAVAKYWTCKRAIAVVAEALECLGGNGYVEESILPRLYREAPLNSIWEGSGNVNALDVLRAMSREPESLAAFRAEIAKGRGQDRRFDDAVTQLDRLLDRKDISESSARSSIEKMAIAIEASLLIRYGDPNVADAFCASRLDGGSRMFGTLDEEGLRLSEIVERHRPYI